MNNSVDNITKNKTNLNSFGNCKHTTYEMYLYNLFFLPSWSPVEIKTVEIFEKLIKI